MFTAINRHLPLIYIMCIYVYIYLFVCECVCVCVRVIFIHKVPSWESCLLRVSARLDGGCLAVEHGDGGDGMVVGQGDLIAFAATHALVFTVPVLLLTLDGAVAGVPTTVVHGLLLTVVTLEHTHRTRINSENTRTQTEHAVSVETLKGPKTVIYSRSFISYSLYQLYQSNLG